MRHVLLVDVAADIGAPLSTLADAEVTAVTIEQLPSAPPPAATVVLLGPAVRDPAGVVRRVGPRETGIRVVVIADLAPDDPLRLMAGREVRVLASARAAELVGLVERLLTDAERHLRYRLSRDRAQVQLQAATVNNLPHQLGHRLFGEMLTHAPVGAVLLDARLAIVAWNDLAAHLLDLGEPRSVGAHFPELFAPQHRQALTQHVSVTVPKRELPDGEPTRPDPSRMFGRAALDGTISHLRLTVQPVTGPAGDRRSLVIVDDLTASVQAHREIQERSRHAVLTADVAAAMTAIGPLPGRLGRCVDAIVAELDAAFARIWTVSAGSDVLQLQASAGLYTHLDGEHARIPIGQFKIGRIAAQRVPHLTNTVIGDAEVHDQQWARRENMVAFAGYPLISGGELVGVLALFARHALAPTTLAALGGVADQIAVGIRQDRLYRQVQSVAEALQRPLLPPRLPAIPGVGLAARYHAHADNTKVGGDFYDVFALPDGRYALTLGDVCGKGPEAAAVTGLVRHTLWTAAQHNADAEYVLPLLNQALLRAGDGKFCTLIYALLEPASPDHPAVRVRLASAGHPPPILSQGGVISTASASGTLLGVSPTVRITAEELTLQPADMFVAYTDGFTEGAGRRKTGDAAHLVAQVLAPPSATTPPADAALIADRLVVDTLQRAGNQLEDDLALLIVQVSGRPDEPSPPPTATDHAGKENRRVA